jgi:hypothetical protein
MCVAQWSVCCVVGSGEAQLRPEIVMTASARQEACQWQRAGGRVIGQSSGGLVFQCAWGVASLSGRGVHRHWHVREHCMPAHVPASASVCAPPPQARAQVMPQIRYENSNSLAPDIALHNVHACSYTPDRYFILSSQFNLCAHNVMARAARGCGQRAVSGRGGARRGPRTYERRRVHSLHTLPERSPHLPPPCRPPG